MRGQRHGHGHGVGAALEKKQERHEEEHEEENRWVQVARAAGYGSAAIVVIGVGGLLAVLSIKWLTRTRFYDYLQQALIALAVGALIGDSFMHLIPHVRAHLLTSSHFSSPSRLVFCLYASHAPLSAAICAFLII